MGGTMRYLRYSFGLTVLSLAGWAVLLLPAVETIWPPRDQWLPALGITVSLLLLATLAMAAQEQTPQPASMQRNAMALILLAAALLLAGIVFQELKPVPAALLLLCGGAALLIAVTAAEQMKDGRTVEVTSHWGGLGGSLGGWRISPLVMTIVLALIFLGAAVAAGLDSSIEDPGNATETKEEEANKQSDETDPRENKAAEEETAENEAAENEAAENEAATENEAALENAAAANAVSAGTNASSGAPAGPVVS